MAGYSGASLMKKLGIKDGSRVLLLGAPAEFELGELPSGAAVTRATRPRSANVAFDVAVVFVRRAHNLESVFRAASAAVEQEGGIWIAWPKKASGVVTDVGEAFIRQSILATDYVDNKVCALDETWSALRFVLRTSARTR